MNIERFVVGPIENNVYIISNNSEAILVDPTAPDPRLENYLKENKLNLAAIFITHYHFDHIGGLEYFKDKYKVPVYDYEKLGKLKIAGLKLEIIPTMGHTKDSVSFYFKDTNNMFVGDFVFEGSIGRMDLEGGDEEEMEYSLKKLKTFPKNTKLYPGHGNITTLEKELLNNPYL